MAYRLVKKGRRWCVVGGRTSRVALSCHRTKRAAKSARARRHARRNKAGR